MVDSERDQVDDPEERVRHHRLDDERRCSGVGLRNLAAECLLHASRDPKDTPADEHRAYEVEHDDDRRVRQCDLSGNPDEEVSAGRSRDIAVENTQSYTDCVSVCRLR